MLRVIEREELKGMMDSGENFVLVNTLDPESYEREHICGSINIPLTSIEAEAPRVINKYETVVVYCSSPECTASAMAGDKLENLGYTDVWRFEGGMKEWKDANYCVEGTAYQRAVA